MTNLAAPAVTMSSNKARQDWSRLLNTTLQGQTTVIERYGGPIAVVIPYYEWVKQKTSSQADENPLQVTAHRDEITDALNQVYGAESSEMDSALVQMQIASLDGDKW